MRSRGSLEEGRYPISHSFNEMCMFVHWGKRQRTMRRHRLGRQGRGGGLLGEVLVLKGHPTNASVLKISIVPRIASLERKCNHDIAYALRTSGYDHGVGKRDGDWRRGRGADLGARGGIGHSYHKRGQHCPEIIEQVARKTSVRFCLDNDHTIVSELGVAFCRYPSRPGI